jgi:hypothetical protein
MTKTELGTDHARALAYLDERLERLEEGRRRRNLENFRERMAAEGVGDVEGVLATLDPAFSLTAYGPDGTRTDVPAGPAIRGLFEGLSDGGRTRVWLEWEHLAVDDDVIIGDGVLNMRLSGAACAAMGYEVPDPDPSLRWARRSRICVTIEYGEDGRQVREVFTPLAAEVSREV